jgi:hypothetical protein
MTIQPWWSDQHVLICAARALNDYLEDEVASWSGQPFTPSQFPVKATQYDAAGVPLNGSYYVREKASGDTRPKMPFVEVSTVQGSGSVNQSDAEAKLMAVQFQIRVSVGFTGGQGGSNTSQQFAATLCTAAQVTVGKWLCAVALELDAGGFGICWVDTVTAPVTDIGASLPGIAPSVVTIDSVCTMRAMQRQFSPAGYFTT